MSRSETRSRRRSLLTTLLTALLVVTFAMSGAASAHPGRGGKHTTEPDVRNEFNGSFFGGVFPASIACEWKHRPGGQYVNAYVCTDDSGQIQQEQRLSDQNDVDAGLLRPGDPDRPYRAANPEEFSCTKVGSTGKPNDYDCRYGHRHGTGWHHHSFRMDEMFMMEDPSPLPAGQTQQIFYVWPPHK